MRNIISTVFERAYDLLEKNRDVLERCAKTLLERETLDEASLVELTGDLRGGALIETAPSPNHEPARNHTAV